MAVSCEPGRKKAYSPDLRWRVVYQRIGMNLTFKRIGQNLGIATSTAHRVYALFEQTGTVDPRSHSTLREELRSLNTHEEIYVVGLILNSPSLYLKEVCRDVGEIFHISVSQPTICRLLRRHGVTRKKIRQVALQRCESLRGAYCIKRVFITFFFHRIVRT